MARSLSSGQVFDAVAVLKSDATFAPDDQIAENRRRTGKLALLAGDTRAGFGDRVDVAHDVGGYQPPILPVGWCGPWPGRVP
jgi:hypothetical protein